MIDGIEPFYRQIAEAIQEAISEPWQTAVVEAVFFSQSSNYVGEFVTSGGVRPKSFGVKLKAIRAFLGLRDPFKKAGKPVWCRAKFEIQSNGKFRMTWGYDDCDENGFAHFDEKRESERMRQIQLRQGFAPRPDEGG